MASASDRHALRAYMVIGLLQALAQLQLIPVFLHMLCITFCTIYIGSRSSVRPTTADAKAVAEQLAGISVSLPKSAKRSSDAADDDSDDESSVQPAIEQLATKDAYMFPVIGSVVLFSLYLTFKFIPKHLINIVVKAYFFLIGTGVLFVKLDVLLASLCTKAQKRQLRRMKRTVINPLYYVENGINFVIERAMSLIGRSPNAGSSQVSINSADKCEADEAVSPTVDVTAFQLLSLLVALGISTLYIVTNHFILSNVYGIAFSIQGIELLSLGSFFNGAILLCGLFVYDIFWVFGTDVMVTVAKSFDAPIKLLFPQCNLTWLLGSGSALQKWAHYPPSMLGLGDIVIPGIFCALMLRFDLSLALQQRQAKAAAASNQSAAPRAAVSFAQQLRNLPYFTTVMVSYVAGLATTVLVMYTFEAAQPALLYLVPACLGSVILLAAARGQFSTLWSYSEDNVEDHDDQSDKQVSEDGVAASDFATSPSLSDSADHAPRTTRASSRKKSKKDA